MTENKLVLSSLNKTWFIDIDGTILIHNGHLTKEGDTPLNSSIDFINSIPNTDYIVLTTARDINLKKQTEEILNKYKIRYNTILYNLPTGERIVINDSKPSGLKMSHAVDTIRDDGIKIKIIIDDNL